MLDRKCRNSMEHIRQPKGIPRQNFAAATAGSSSWDAPTCQALCVPLGWRRSLVAQRPGSWKRHPWANAFNDYTAEYGLQFSAVVGMSDIGSRLRLVLPWYGSRLFLVLRWYTGISFTKTMWLLNLLQSPLPQEIFGHTKWFRAWARACYTTHGMPATNPCKGQVYLKSLWGQSVWVPSCSFYFTIEDI